jgi:hypothetical protein
MIIKVAGTDKTDSFTNDEFSMQFSIIGITAVNR